MGGRPHRIRAVEEYWWHVESLQPGDSKDTRAFADAAVSSLEAVLGRLQEAAEGNGSIEPGLPLGELKVLVYGKQKRIEELEGLLNAAYETYADDGFLVTKNEWLDALLLLVKEKEKS
jgi:hypothetical protein